MRNSICPECKTRLCAHGPQRPQKPLTPRQKELLSLLSGGLSNKEIATEMGISEGRAKTFLCRDILPRIGMTTRLEGALWARDHAELLKPTPPDGDV